MNKAIITLSFDDGRKDNFNIANVVLNLRNILDFISDFFVDISCDNYINVKYSTVCIYDNNETRVLANTIPVKNTTRIIPQKNAFIYNIQMGKSPKQVDFIVYPYNKKAYKWTIML